MKIFIGPKEIAGYYNNLASGLKKNGYNCDLILFEKHSLGYNSNTHRFRIASFIQKVYKNSQKIENIIIKRIHLFLAKILNVIWASYIILKYDVFIFGFGYSLLPKYADLPFLKFLGKTVILNLGHGSDLRPPYADGGVSYNNINDLKKDVDKKRNRAIIAERYADYIIAAPYSSQFLERKCINWFNLGIPFDDLEDDSPQSTQINEKPIILHCPSNINAKGTILIRKAVNDLKKEGFNFEFVEFTNIPHSEVIKYIQKSDFIVDQAYSDSPMAAFSTEAAFFGKPAIVSGYDLDRLKVFVDNDNYPPTLICTPDELKNSIKKLIVDIEFRVELGRKAKEFVENQWSIDRITNKYIQLIQKNYTGQWDFDPTTISYYKGSFQDKDKTKFRISALVNQYGKRALRLEHRPDLEQKYLKFAGID